MPACDPGCTFKKKQKCKRVFLLDNQIPQVEVREIFLL